MNMLLSLLSQTVMLSETIVPCPYLTLGESLYNIINLSHFLEVHYQLCRKHKETAVGSLRRPSHGGSPSYRLG